MGVFDSLQDAIKKTTPGLSSGQQETLTEAAINQAAGTNPVSQVHATKQLGEEGHEDKTYALDPKDWSGVRADKAAEESGFSANSALQLDADWLNYLKGLYEPYSDVATASLGKQAGMSGLFGEEAKQEFVSGIESDPLYQAKVAAGEEGVLRNQSATGGLRSGNAIDALAKGNQQLLGNEFNEKYNRYAGLSGQGFQGSTALGQFGGQTIGSMTNTMGNIESGNVAANAAKQARADDMVNTVGSVIGGIFSDERLKTNVEPIGYKNGLTVYRWEWNQTASDELGLTGESEGHLAGEVAELYPHLVGESHGYKTVNYEGLK